MPSSLTFYLTTTLPYVNAEPHVGFALEIIEADVICRYQRQQGKEVVFNTGTDEHGQKIYQKALAAGMTPQAYCDHYAEKFADLKKILNLDFSNFIRTTDKNHQQAAQEFWRRCDKNGDIYKKNYQIKYCVGCELEKTESELVAGRCPLHPDSELELREEENYFFRFSKYQQPLLDFYQQRTNRQNSSQSFVYPMNKFSEIKSFVKQGLQDFSISRLKAKMPWGIPVPGDDQHVMYVWFDALINYISTLGWPTDQENFNKFWPGIQLCGKDNLRQQAAMWQAMLMSAHLPNSQQILINGFISVNGQKMSKSLGNVISPTELVDKYGLDAARYLIINIGTFTGTDMDVSWDKFDQIYTANLANALGNSCSRVAKMASQIKLDFKEKDSSLTIPQLKQNYDQTDQKKYHQLMKNYQLTAALNEINQKINCLDDFLSANKPWEKDQAEQKNIIAEAIYEHLLPISFMLQPFMPQTAELIRQHFSVNQIAPLKPLFPRLKPSQ